MASYPVAESAEMKAENEAAHRAIEAYFDKFAEVLGQPALEHLVRLLADTEHHHESMLIAGPHRLSVTVRIRFGSVTRGDE